MARADWSEIDEALKAGEVVGVPAGVDLEEFLWQLRPEARAEIEAMNPGRKFKSAEWAKSLRPQGLMTVQQADAMAKIQWGPRGYARVNPAGYEVGYYRTGKRHRRLTTVKGESRESFEEALELAERAMTAKQREKYVNRRLGL